jgi:hypothetical protein
MKTVDQVPDEEVEAVANQLLDDDIPAACNSLANPASFPGLQQRYDQRWATNFEQQAKVVLGELGGTPVSVWQNTWGVDLVVRLAINITTPAAAELNFGVAAAPFSAEDNLLDGLDASVAGFFSSNDSQGTNGATYHVVSVNWHITGHRASGSTVGMVSDVYVYFRRL